MTGPRKHSGLRKYLPWTLTAVLFIGFYIIRGKQVKKLAEGGMPATNAFIKSLRYTKVTSAIQNEDAAMRELIERALEANGLILGEEKPFTAENSDERLLSSTDFSPCEASYQEGDILGLGEACPQTQSWIVVSEANTTPSIDEKTWVTAVSKGFALNFEMTELQNSLVHERLKHLNMCICLRHKDFLKK